MIDVMEPHNTIKASLRLTGSTDADAIDLVVSLEAGHPHPPPEHIQVVLACHEVVSSSWCARVSCARAPDSQQWKASVSISGDHPRLLEVTKIESASELAYPKLKPDVILHLEPEQPGEWVTGPEATRELNRRKRKREELFGQPLLAPGATTDSATFAAVMVTDNVHLTMTQRVPGLTVIPLQRSTLGLDIASVLNDVLRSLGYQWGVEPAQWVSMMQRQNPAAIVHAPTIKAPSLEDAQAHVRQLAHKLLDITALRRGASPRLLGGAMLTTDADGLADACTVWVESQGYTGNLLGGFVSGEDAHELLAMWDGTLADPRTQLWLSMYADALADSRQDYRFFRTFNLLEAIATEVIPSKQVVVDPQGNELFGSDEKPYTTEQARGKVYDLLKKVADVSQTQLSSLATSSQIPDPAQMNTFLSVPGDLWDELDVWVKIRNAVAHRGTWRLPSGEVPDARREKLERRIEKLTTASGGDGKELGGLLMTISRTCETTLHQAISGRL